MFPNIDWSLVSDEKQSCTQHTTTGQSKIQTSSYTRDSGCPTHNFSLVICRRRSDNAVLAVNECNNKGWWVPGGWVDPGETMMDAAIRETKEEAGVDIVVKGILRVEHTHYETSARLRIIFYAEPRDEAQATKSEPDEHSIEARFVRENELDGLGRIRGGELKEWSRYLNGGGPIFPLALLATDEGEPVTLPETSY